MNVNITPKEFELLTLSSSRGEGEMCE